MNFDLNEFNKAEAKEFGEYETLESGGHIVEIVNAYEHTSEMSNKTSLKVEVDTCKNDKQPGFFRNSYNNDTRQNKKWPNGGVKYLSLANDQLSYLKGFITALENSNKGFKFDTNGKWEQLKGLKCAAQFGQEEFEKQDGTIGLATKLVAFRSLDKLNDIKVPNIKKLDKAPADNFKEFEGVVEIDDNFLD